MELTDIQLFNLIYAFLNLLKPMSWAVCDGSAVGST
jgi:hypothetical protein